jgi:hypothetical protein
MTQSVALVHETPLNSALAAPAGSALVATDHVVPLHFSTSVRLWATVDVPTARQLVVLVHATPLNRLFVEPTSGAPATIDQLEPFHASISVAPTPPTVLRPTAKQLVALAHDTPVSTALLAPTGFGLATIDPADPFHCSINVDVKP